MIKHLEFTINNLFGQRWHGSAVKQAFDWWRQELLGMLPLAGNRATQQEFVTWPLAADVVLSGQKTSLILAESQVLLRFICLPRAALKNLTEVLRYELDKYAPYQAEDVCFAGKVTALHDDYIDVILVVILREQVDEMVAGCQEAGLSLRAIDVKDKQGLHLGLNLLPYIVKNEVKTSRWWLPHSIVMLCIVLSIINMSLWLRQHREQLSHAQVAVSELRTQLRKTEREQRGFERARKSAAWVAGQKNEYPGLSVMLASLTQCLPVDSWVQDLDVSERSQISLTGQSSNASQLAAELKHCPGFRDPRFQGVIQPDAATGKDRFSLIVEQSGESQ